jgi:hypothetical protein
MPRAGPPKEFPKLLREDLRPSMAGAIQKKRLDNKRLIKASVQARWTRQEAEQEARQAATTMSRRKGREEARRRAIPFAMGAIEQLFNAGLLTEGVDFEEIRR